MKDLEVQLIGPPVLIAGTLMARFTHGPSYGAFTTTHGILLEILTRYCKGDSAAVIFLNTIRLTFFDEFRSLSHSREGSGEKTRKFINDS
jgi:hypothetical protein